MTELETALPISQRNPSWSKILLGYNTDPSFTIGSHGCLITSVAHYLQSLGYDTDPKLLNKQLKEVNGFIDGGLYVFEALTKIYPEITLKYTSKKYVGVPTPTSFFNDMRAALDKGYYLLVETDFDPVQYGQQMHWVGCYGYTDNNDFLIMDPWTGTNTLLSIYGKLDNCTYSFRYYSPSLQNALQGADPCRKIKDDLKALEDRVATVYRPKIDNLEAEVLRIRNKIYSVGEAFGLLLDSIKNSLKRK